MCVIYNIYITKIVRMFIILPRSSRNNIGVVRVMEKRQKWID